MHVLDLYQHRKTGDIVRIEMCRGGLLSFSIWMGGHWVMNQDPWDETQFRQKFRRIYTLPPSTTLPN